MTRRESSSRFSLSKTLLCAIAAVVVIASTSVRAQIDVPRCPVRVGNTTILDKNTPFIGNAACDALKDADRLADALNKGVKHYQNAAQKDIDDLNKVMFNDAINKDAIKKFNKAASIWNDIMDDVNDLVEDDQCGKEGVYRNLTSFFNTQVSMMKQMGEIANQTGTAVGKLQPVPGELLNISKELANIATIASGKSAESKTQFEKLKRSIDGLIKDFNEIKDLNGIQLATDGLDLATTIGPFFLNCSACAGSLGAAVGGLGTGTATAGAGAGGCPETAVAYGGSCWATVAGVPVAGASAVGGGVLSDISCQEVTKSFNKLNDYTKKISNFINTITRVSRSVVDNIQDVAEASAALQALAKELGNESKPSIQAMQKSMDNISDALEQTQDYAEKQVMPKVGGLGDKVIRTIATSVTQVKTCFDMYVDALGQVTNESVQAAANLIAAETNLINANKVLDNMATQAEKAVDAATKAAKSKFESVEDKFTSLHKVLFGQGPVRDFTKIDVGKATGAIAALAADEKRRDKAFDKAEDLVAAINGLVAASVDAGKDAFLGRDRADKTRSVKNDLQKVEDVADRSLAVLTKAAPKKVKDARETVASPKEEAKKAAIEKAKRKAKLAAERNMRQAAIDKQPDLVIPQLKPVSPNIKAVKFRVGK